jgi:hypothetical protein
MEQSTAWEKDSTAPAPAHRLEIFILICNLKKG